MPSTMASNGLPVAAPRDQNYIENGRTYHGFRRGLYMYPCDEEEKDRMDIYHKIFEVARCRALHSAPLTANNPNDPARVLDVGSGTGIWAIDMADKYPLAEIQGMDLVNIQPEAIPPNLRFRVPRDHESIWNFGEESWDLIHIQMASGSVSCWPDLYQKVFAHLKPGSGWIEQVEIDMKPRCDNGSLAANSALVQWYNYLDEATRRSGKPIAFEPNTKDLLRLAGFIDVREEVIRAPLNGWPTDPHQKAIGRWYNIGLSEGLMALSAAPFTRVNKWNMQDHVSPLIKEVQKEMLKVQAYNNIHIIYARKPL